MTPADAPSAASATAPHRRVLARLLGPEATRDAFTASLKELLNRLGVELVADATTRPDDSNFLAVAQVTFSETDCALTVDDAEGRLGLRRRLAGTGPVVIETAAHVVQSAVEELVLPQLNRRVEVPKPSRAPLVPVTEEAPPVVTVRPSAPETSPTGIAVGIHLGARSLSQKAPAVLAAGVDASYTAELFQRLFGVGLALTYVPELEATSENIGLRIQGLSPRARVSMQLVGGAQWGLDLSLGGGADLFLSHVTSSLVPPNRLRPMRFDATPVLTASLSWHRAIAENAGLVVALGGDVDLWPITWVARLGPQTETLLSPWSVRPTLTIGVTFSPGERLAGSGGGVP